MIRKMSYMRAIVRGSREPVDLEDIIRTQMSGRALPLKILSGDRVIEAIPLPDLDGFNGVALHLVAYQEDTHEILIDHGKDELETLPPPDESDFVRGRLFAIITDCHIVGLPIHPLRNSLAIHFSRGLEVQSLSQEQIDALNKVTFVKPPAKDKLEMIENIGVKEIKLDWSIPASHIAEQLNQQAATPLGVIRSFLAGDDDSADGPQAEGELVFKASLKPKTRHGELREIELYQEKNMAKAIVDDDDGYDYVITLKNGVPITPESMEVSRPQTFEEEQPGMILPEDAFSALLEYHRELRDNGAFD